MANKPELKLDVGDSSIGTLLFDKPVSGTNSNGEWNMYTLDIEGIEMVHFASENAHNTLRGCSKGDTVSIEHKPRPKGGSMYIVDIVGQSDIKSKNTNANNNSSVFSDDRDLSIKWGMAFNNATRLVANISTDEGVVDKVALIKDIMPSMFEVACSMPSNQVVEEPAAQEEDDDLPF